MRTDPIRQRTGGELLFEEDLFSVALEREIRTETSSSPTMSPLPHHTSPSSTPPTSPGAQLAQLRLSPCPRANSMATTLIASIPSPLSDRPIPPPVMPPFPPTLPVHPTYSSAPLTLPPPSVTCIAPGNRSECTFWQAQAISSANLDQALFQVQRIKRENAEMKNEVERLTRECDEIREDYSRMNREADEMCRRAKAINYVLEVAEEINPRLGWNAFKCGYF